MRTFRKLQHERPHGPAAQSGKTKVDLDARPKTSSSIPTANTISTYITGAVLRYYMSILFNLRILNFLSTKIFTLNLHKHDFCPVTGVSLAIFFYLWPISLPGSGYLWSFANRLYGCYLPWSIRNDINRLNYLLLTNWSHLRKTLNISHLYYNTLIQLSQSNSQ